LKGEVGSEQIDDSHSCLHLVILNVNCV